MLPIIAGRTRFVGPSDLLKVGIHVCVNSKLKSHVVDLAGRAIPLQR